MKGIRENFRIFRKNKPAFVGLIIIGIYLFLAIFAPVLFDPEMVTHQDYSAMLAKPSMEHWFGTDDLGRDLFIRLVYGSRVSLLVGFLATLIGMAAGSVVGAFCAYIGGIADNLIMRFFDIIYSIPFTLLAMLLAALWGKGQATLVIALSISSVLTFAKTTRGSVMAVAEQDYVKAARACGTGVGAIVFKHLLPNTSSVIITNAAFNMVSTMLAASALSFIGVGIQEPNPEWGAILAAGKSFIQMEPRLVVLPVLVIVLATVSITLVGNGLRDVFDPKMRKGGS